MKEVILPIISSYTSLLSLSWTLTSRKKILQYDFSLNTLRVLFLFMMFATQIVTRTYILLFILFEVQEIGGWIGILTGFICPLTVHLVTMMIIERKKGVKERLFAISKLFYFDIDEKPRFLVSYHFNKITMYIKLFKAILNTLFIHAEHLCGLFSIFLVYKFVRLDNPHFSFLPFILLFASLSINLIWFFALRPKPNKSGKNEENSEENGSKTPMINIYEYK